MSRRQDGISKRKRNSEPDAENFPVPEAKRLREESEIPDNRQPLAELPLGARLSANDSDSDCDFLEARAEELDDSNDSHDSISKADISSLSVDESEPSPGPLDSTLARVLFESHKRFTCKLDLVNFFKRKNCSSSDDRTGLLFEVNPQLQPRMRSVLLEWIVEVCDVYKLHRETYHLTVDYLDRYLCKSRDISKSQLQLIGVTALLIAAKYEEIYPPKISDFAYITDGACSERDILKMESLMIQVLEWRCTIITSNAWLLGFLQLLSLHENEESQIDITVPLYNPSVYARMAHLLDACTLDSNFIPYPYKLLALSSIHTVVSDPNPVVLEVSEFSLEQLADCMAWMQPFWAVLCQKFDYEAADSGGLQAREPNPDVTHLRAKHNVDLDLLEAVKTLAEAKHAAIPELLLTPPLSTEKTTKARR